MRARRQLRLRKHAGSAVMFINVPVCAFIVRIGPSAVMNTDFIASVSQ